MEEKEKKGEEEKGTQKKRKPYEKPSLTPEELFEPTALACQPQSKPHGKS